MYLDVTSYMLTVLTFSVGFLSTRRHAHFDVLAKDLADRSWKIRQALNSGQQLGPRDLAEDVVAVTAERDSVASFARLVNGSFFVGAVAVFLMAMTDRSGWHEVTLMSLLFVSTTLVFALGEYDVRWMSARERDLARGTVLGQLAAVDLALRHGDASLATAEIASLREAFPSWTFGMELELILDNVSRDSAAESTEGVGRSSNLVDASGGLYAAPMLVAEGRLRARDPIGALQDFQIVIPRSVRSRSSELLAHVLGFAAALPKAVFVDSPDGRRDPSEPSGLELGLDTLPAIRDAARAFRDFSADLSLADWLERHPEGPVALAARLSLSPEDKFEALLAQSDSQEHVGALNTIGIVCLARGRNTEALKTFEAAIRARPNSSTSHWGRSVACARREWTDAALDSLKRSEALDPRSRAVLRLTRKAILGELDADDDALARRVSVEESDLERVQLALLGLAEEAVQPAVTPRSELVSQVVRAAGELTRTEVQ